MTTSTTQLRCYIVINKTASGHYINVVSSLIFAILANHTMWTIVEIINNTSPQQQILLSGGGVIVGIRRGPEGSSYRIIVVNKGFLDLVDVGWGTSSWEIDINGSRFKYQGEGQVTLTFNNDGTFAATGHGNNITGNLLPLLPISEVDIALLKAMMEIKLVPYQNIPDAPGKTDEEITEAGNLYFPFAGSTDSRILSYCVYDWTSPSFFRMVLFKVFRYTSIVGKPLDHPTIANLIWTSNWPPFTPQNEDFMHSLLMVPASSEEDVAEQLEQNHYELYAFNEAQNSLNTIAFYSMPRTSTHNIPQLFSGQPDISNLGLDRFAPEFLEFPGNAGPTTDPLEMPFNDALNTVFKVGNTITSKGILSFTSSQDTALQYSNGILLVVNPPSGAISWANASYITPLSNDPAKDEYTFAPGSQFLIQNVEEQTISGKDVWVFTMQNTG